MKFLRRLGCLTLVLIVACGYAGYRALQPYKGFQDAVYVNVARGSSTGTIAEQLTDAGVVKSRIDFFTARLAQRVLGRGRVLQAGEYRFDKAASAYDVANRISRGDTFAMTLTLPEGYNLFDIGAEGEKQGLFAAKDFVAAAKDPKLIADLDPKAPTLEGYLFPDTYKLPKRIKPEELCKLMTAKFRSVWKEIGGDQNVHDVITLASMVEREGKVAEDRPLIAAVFSNRLKIGMKLDCDPTTIYAALLDGRYRGVIHRSDLASENAYNTYQHAGLPPGPIANPGRASIEAALNPAESDALFFVLRPDGSGRHEFTKTLGEHNKAVGSYRRGQK